MSDALCESRFTLSTLIAAIGVTLLPPSPPMSLFAQANRETEGVRARLYWVGGEIEPERLLAPNQSPNLDVTIPNFSVSGGESWFEGQGRKYKSNYVLVLEATVEFEEEDEVMIRIRSTAPTTLEIDGEEVVVVEDAEPVVEEFESELDRHRFKITQYVNDEPRAVRLEWRTDEDAPFMLISTNRLKTEDFYFRPTNSTTKRMVDFEDRPGKYEKLVGVYPAVELMTIRPPGVDVPVGGLDILPDGRLVVATFDARRLRAPTPQQDPDGELWLYANIDADRREQVQRQRIAEGLFEPCGVCVVGESVYVSQRDEITRFDEAGTERAWQRTTIASGWESNDFHALSFGLVHRTGTGDHPGYLFMARGTGLGLMKNPPNHGSVWRVDLSQPVGTNVESITGGHRTPNGIGVGPEEELFVTDNQGEWTPANELNHVSVGSFYGFRHRTDNGGAPTPFQDQPTTHPAVILPQDEIANSPSEPVLIPAGWPYAGQLLVGDVKYGGINRISLEKVRGKWQGAAFRFTQGLEGGVNRLVFDKDGNLFIGAIGGDHASTWNWVNPDGENTYQGLQRLRLSGQSVFDLETVEVTKRGFRIRFTQPVPTKWLSDVSNYLLTQWRYEATADYGGPKLDVTELRVTKAIPQQDSGAVELIVEGRRPGHVIHFVVDAVSTGGSPIWSAEAWYTMWELPE